MKKQKTDEGKDDEALRSEPRRVFQKAESLRVEQMKRQVRPRARRA